MTSSTGGAAGGDGWLVDHVGSGRLSAQQPGVPAYSYNAGLDEQATAAAAVPADSGLAERLHVGERIELLRTLLVLLWLPAGAGISRHGH